MKVILAESLKHDTHALRVHSRLQTILTNNNLVLGAAPQQLTCEAHLMPGFGKQLVVDFVMKSSVHDESFSIGGTIGGLPLSAELIMQKSTWYMDETLFCQVALNASRTSKEILSHA